MLPQNAITCVYMVTEQAVAIYTTDKNYQPPLHFQESALEQEINNVWTSCYKLDFDSLKM